MSASAPPSAFWKDRPVFVTGATGLLGSHLVEELLARGAAVTCLVRDWVPRARMVEEGFLERVSCVRGELEDPAVLVRALNEHEIDTVLHVGAQTIVGTAARSPLSTFESNVRGTWNLLDACRECSRLVKRIVIASSDKAYGAHAELPYKETTSLEGRFPYDASKAAGDVIAMSYHATYRLPLAITRCGNLFGPGDLNWNRLIPGTIRSALRGENPVIRSDGTYVRDYFYVKDAVEAYLLLAERLPETQLVGQAFNFGTETPMPVLDVVTTILRLMGKEALRPTILNEASNEIPRQFLDCRKARAGLAWRPKRTMEQGLRETIGWYERWLADDRIGERGRST